jgi:hypothetical protein
MFPDRKIVEWFKKEYPNGTRVELLQMNDTFAPPIGTLGTVKGIDDMTKGSGDARTQPLFFLITTAGTDTHSICFEQHQKALDIIEGT